MAAGGYREFLAGETLDEDAINDYLMQGVLVFAGTAARGSAITSPVEGQFTFRTDDDVLEYFDGSDWVELSSDPQPAVVSATTGSPGTATSGGYDYYAFTGDGSITFSDAGFVDCFLVGGGGAGSRSLDSASSAGGGGGAGGVLLLTNRYVAAGTATITVGAGGASSTGTGSIYQSTGQEGFSSNFNSIYAIGGGHGGPATSLGSPRPGVGGSGGGGSSDTGSSGISGQGNAGGDGDAGDGGGGGGGAGAAGDNAVPGANTGGDGGIGTTSGSVWGIATNTGEDVGGVHYFAGGGGGGADGGGAGGGAGGSGGGGAGADSGNAATSGSANTGGGGGGSQTNNSGAGGSGIVIVRVSV